MSKSKENVPTHPPSRNSRSKVNLTAAGPSDEFFTDSILESDATRTTKIPTPVPQKQVRARSRRTKHAHKTSLGESVNRKSATVAESALQQHHDTGLRPPIALRRPKSPSPLRTNVAATPPQTRHTLDLTSPTTDLRSPPPREFTDVYRQIADEEDLAATERELSDSDGSFVGESEDEPAVVIHQKLQAPQNPNLRSAPTRLSRGSTPTQQSMPHVTENTNLGSAETMSEPTGMSFLNDLTDQRLAAALTPHMSESARDRAKLREVWSNQKPVAFTKAYRASSTSVPSTQEFLVSSPRLKAFSKATRPRDLIHENDQGRRPSSRHSDGSLENYVPQFDPSVDNDRPLKQLPINSRIERNLHFSRRHGFPIHRPALTEQNLEQQNQGVRANHAADPVFSQPYRARLGSGSDYSDRAQRIKQPVLDINNSRDAALDDNHDAQIDWAAVAAKVPLPPGDSSSISPDKSVVQHPAHNQVSSEKSRRWDIDLTGHSFQVSESPPVRNKQSVSDRSLGKEIESLTKRAVTTSRLGEIRERQSEEQLRGKSQSPAPRPSLGPAEKRQENHSGSRQASVDRVGEAVPDTPVVIFRSRSSSSNDRKAVEANGDSKSHSDEVLQRFARAMSNTPKSSPSVASVDKHKEQREITSNTDSRDVLTVNELGPHRSGTKSEAKVAPGVTETPKITGGWTDTILPDTIKTTKRPLAQSTYLKTPHVSAGGWIDTPAPNEIKPTKEEMTPIMEEILEELTNGIVKSKNENASDGQGEKPEDSSPPNVTSIVPKSGLAGILDRAKEKLTSQEVAIAPRDNDTLNLGNETIESLQDLLTLDADEFTILSKVFNDEDDGHYVPSAQEEAAILERINIKLDRLRNNLHETRKGISQLEHKVSQPATLNETLGQLSSTTTCTTCHQPNYTALHSQSHGKMLPVTPLQLTLPIPLLFHSDSKSLQAINRSYFGFRIPRPTPLGYLTLAIWLWYVMECTLAEIYSHPTHAEQYTWPSSWQSEPEFPYVLPTMLSRWFRLENLSGILLLLFGWLFTMTRAVGRILNMWLGFTDGFVDTAANAAAAGIAGVLSASPSVSKILTTTASAAWAVGQNGPDTDLSMMNDEYL